MRRGKRWRFKKRGREIRRSEAGSRNLGGKVVGKKNICFKRAERIKRIAECEKLRDGDSEKNGGCIWIKCFID